MEQQTITLTPGDSNLVGKYRQNSHVLLLLDASEAPFTVNLPDSTSVVNTVFDCARKDQIWANVVTVTPFPNQQIKNCDEIKVRVDDSWELRKEDGGVNWWIG